MDLKIWGSSEAYVAVGITLGFASSFFAGPFAPLIGIVGWAATTAYLPDVHVGISIQNSRVLKQLAYHEFAHASHFMNVGGVYWDELVLAEVANNGHGTASSNGAGIIALCESWAEHIGLSYQARQYGVGVISLWDILERTRNESPNHIPIGVYHDLIDNVSDTDAACDEVGGQCGVINDLATTFTNAQMFNILDENTKSPNTFRIRLTTGTALPVTNQVNDLFLSY